MTSLAAQSAARAPDQGSERAAEFLGDESFALVTELAHDCRSPLSCILLLTDVLLQGQFGGLNPIQTQQLRLVHGAALGLAATMSSVMELARHTGRLTDEPPEPYAISSVVETVTALATPRATERGIALRAERMPGELRMGWPRALRLALLNLTTYGLRGSAGDEVVLTARPLRDDPDRVQFAVRDTIKEARGHPASLFEPFASADSEKPYDFSAPGLGLFVARKLIHEMGGTLRMASHPRAGSQFSFVLPLPRARDTLETA